MPNTLPVSKYQNYAVAIGKTLWKFFMFLYHLHLAFHFGRSMIDMLDKPWARPSQKRQSKKYNVWVPRCCCPYSVSYSRCSYVPSYSNTLHYSCLLEHSWVFKTASNLNWCLKKKQKRPNNNLVVQPKQEMREKPWWTHELSTWGACMSHLWLGQC